VTDGAPRFPVPKDQSQLSNQSSTKFKTQVTIGATSTVDSPSKPTEIAPRKLSMMNYATPEVMVSAFCRAVLARIVPNNFWGTGDVQVHNEKVFLKNIDRFIGLRRFESLSLHEVSQGLQVPFPSTSPPTQLL
jgi:telomerase reverse transcriptase